MAEMANAAGIAVVIGEDAMPMVRIENDLSVTARLLGQIVARLDLFSMSGELIFFDHAGERQTMTATRFCTWIRGEVLLYDRRDKQTQDPIPRTLSKGQSEIILAAQDFLRGVRKLAGINTVRCPVIRPAGALELLPWGFDEQTQIYTVPGGLEYDEAMAWEAAKGHFHRAFHQFPIADSRSMSVQIAAMLSIYVRHLPNGMSLRPGWVWYANKQGSGKSVLAKAALYPVLGHAAAAKLKRDEDLDKEIEAFTRAKVPYIFLDNVRGGLNSPTLEQMLTSKRSTGRAMGGHDVFHTENTALLLVSANQVEFNDDMRRRFLLVDLFEEFNPEERKVDSPLDDDVMECGQWRKAMLAAMWALVRHWHEAGRPVGSVVMPSFEKYAALLGGIVEAAGYHPPFERWVLPDAKGTSREDFHELLALVIDEMGGSGERDYTLEDLARLARAGELYLREVGTQEDGRMLTIERDGIPRDQRALAVDRGYLSNSHKTGFSRKIIKEIGTKPDVKGKLIQFGKREQGRKATYTVRID